MRQRITRYSRRHPIKTGVMAFLVVCAAFAATVYAVDVSRWWLFNLRLQALMDAPTSGRPEVREWKVLYGGSLYRLRAHVYPSELEAGRALNTAWVFESPPSVRERYVRSLVRAESRTRLTDELVGQLRSIARRQSLNDDEYAELLARSVQNISYGSIGREINLPAEVLEGGQGVCTEKSVLLASLLLHEGYDTALLVLDRHNHVAVGLRSDGPRFRSLPYAFVETTRTARIGEVSVDYLGWGPVGAPPQTITLGGTKRYRGDGATAGVDVLPLPSRDLVL